MIYYITQYILIPTPSDDQGFTGLVFFSGPSLLFLSEISKKKNIYIYPDHMFVYQCRLRFRRRCWQGF